MRIAALYIATKTHAAEKKNLTFTGLGKTGPVHFTLNTTCFKTKKTSIYVHLRTHSLSRLE